MTRRDARELAFILLFEKSFGDRPVEEIIEAAVEARDVKVHSFTVQLVSGVSQNEESIDELIYSYSQKWGKGRISRVAMAILRLAVFEMRYIDDIPENVSISEAVELSKLYGGDEDSVFVNGVLGGISRGGADTAEDCGAAPGAEVTG